MIYENIANKPKNNLRIVFYIEFLVPKNKFLFNIVKIKRQVYLKLNQNKKKLCSHYHIIN